MIILNFLIRAAMLLPINAQNYCARELCRGRRHIACNNNGRWAPGCNGRLIDIRPHINLILQLHNERRNTVAAGRLPRFPAAVQMATMSWDPELARLAVYNALRCRMEHDECRSTNAFRYAGQNLSILFSRNVNIVAFLRQRIESWFNEHRNTNVNDIRSYRPRGGPMIGHFTAMVHERNSRVGCAIAQFTINRRENTLLVCNYAVTNMINNPIYRTGRTASGCRTGRSPRYTSLCSVNERYNYNEWRG